MTDPGGAEGEPVAAPPFRARPGRGRRPWPLGSRPVAFALAALLPLGAVLQVLGADATGTVLRLGFASVAPGWLLLRLARLGPSADPGRDVLRALALSPLALSLAALSIHGLGVPFGPAAWSAGIAVAVGLVLAALRRPLADPPPPEPGAREAAWMALLAALALGFVGFVLASPGNRLSYHGLLHGGLVAQIAAGIVPPDNPALAAEPIGFYWLFHWLLAVHGALSGTSPLVTGPVLGGVSLVVYLGAGHRLLRRFWPAGVAVPAALAVGFAGNWLFPLLFAARALAGEVPDGVVWPFQMLQAGALGGDPRLVTLLAKFLNQGGFALGLALWSLLLDETTPGRRDTSWLMAFLLLASLVLFHTTTALGACVALGAAFLVGALGGDGAGADGPRRFRRAALALAAAVVATAPYWTSITVGTHAVGGPPLPTAGELRYSLVGALGSATPVVGVPLLWAFAWRRPVPRFLWATATALVAAGVALWLPDGNQYKFLLMAALPTGALWLALARGAPRVVVAAVVALAVAGHALTAVAYLGSVMPARTRYAGQGTHLAVPGAPGLDEALAWIRRETPADAVVVVPPVRFGASPVRAVTGRSEAVLLGGHQTRGHPAFEPRLVAAGRLFAPEGDAGPPLRVLAEAVGRPLYVLVARADLSSTYDALVAKLDRAPEAVVLRHRGAGARVYEVVVPEVGAP